MAADNTLLNAGTGGDTVRSLARAAGTPKTSIVQLDLGGVTANAEVLITAGQQVMAVSVPVVIASNQTTLPVSGTFFQATQPVSAASLPLPTGAATETSLAGVRTDIGTDGTTPPTVLGSGTGVRGWLRSIYEKLTGTLAVTGTFFQATQPVSIAAVVTTTVTSNGVVSTVNSTSVALGSSGVFTGTSEDVTEYADVRISVFADQASAADGFQMQQSSNGTNWDLVDSYTIPASTGKTFSIGVAAKFFRIVYTNAATVQTVLRLQTIYHKSYTKGSSVRPQDGRSIQNDCEEVNANLMGYDAASTSWNMLRASITNGLLADVSRIVAPLPAGTNVLGGVTGTFFQTTQPVSLATNTPDVTDRSGRLLGTIANTSFAATNAGTFAVQAAATLAAETTKVIGTVNLSAAQTLATVTTVGAVTGITNALPTGTNSIGTVQAPTLTKSTQGTTGITTQSLKDAGRVNISMTCYQAAGIMAAEALFAASTFAISRDGATATTGQQLAVTAGKRFRLQYISVGIKNGAAGAGTSKIVLRYAAAGGTITTSSPILAIMDLGSNSAVAADYIGPTSVVYPDGVELIAGSTFGFTNISSAVTMLHTITVSGYEY